MKGELPPISDPATNNYLRSPLKRGVRQGLLIIVSVFLLGALLQVLAGAFHFPAYVGDAVAILGLIAGVSRIIFAVIIAKRT